MFLNDNLYTDETLKDPAAFKELPLFTDAMFRTSSQNTKYLQANPSMMVRRGEDFMVPFKRADVPRHNPRQRSYDEFFQKYDALDDTQKERAEALVSRIVFSALQFQEWGTIHHAKMMDRHAWHYYVDNGKFPDEYPMPHFAWMDDDDIKRLGNRNDNEAKEARYRRVLEHLKHPSAEGMMLPAKQMASPREAHLIPWQFDEKQVNCNPEKGVFELPFPHEIGLSEVTREHSEKVYTLRHKLRSAMSRIDDQDVINAVFSHPDVRDNVNLLQFYAGLCEGEQERFFEGRAHAEIGKVLARGFGNFSDEDLQKLGKPSSEGGLLPFHKRAFAEVSRTITQNLSERQKQHYFDITDNEPVDLEAIARTRFTQLLKDGKYEGTLSKKDRLALLIGLLGEYGYSENYTLLAANELNFIEQASIQRNLDGEAITPGITYGPDMAVAFPGAGSLPLSAIFKHVMTDCPMILIDIDPDALKGAKELIGRLEQFGVVTPGKIVCAAPCSAEEYFNGVPSKAEPMKEGFFAGKLGMDGRMLAPSAYERPLISSVELASLLPDQVKYKTVESISQLPQALKPDAIMCRTTFGKATSVYDKVPRLPMCLSYNYRGSATPKTVNTESKSLGPSVSFYNDSPLTQVSAAHLFMRPGFGSKFSLPIAKPDRRSIPVSKILEQEADTDPAFGALRRPEIDLLKNRAARVYHSMGFSIGSEIDDPLPPQGEPDWSSRRAANEQGEDSWIARRNDVASGESRRPGG